MLCWWLAMTRRSKRNDIPMPWTVSRAEVQALAGIIVGAVLFGITLAMLGYGLFILGAAGR